MVTSCTTSFTLTNVTFCPTPCILCFMWISEQTAIISLYNIDWLVFVTDTESVYCAVRTGSLNIIQVNSLSFGRGIAQAISCRPFATEARDSSRSVRVKLWCSEWQWGRFLSKYFGFPLLVSFHQCSILIYSSLLRPLEGLSGETWEPPKKKCSRKYRSIKKVHSNLFVFKLLMQLP